MSTYDQWKLRSPDDERGRYGYYDDEEPEDEGVFCAHEEYDADWEGRAVCLYCGHSWWQTQDEIEAEERFQAEYAKHVMREERRERWARWGQAWRWFWYRATRKIIGERKATNILHGDEIPF